jgi:hypothetical protein
MALRMRLVGLGVALCGVLATGQAAFADPPAPVSDPTGGMFVIGDGNVTPGQTVEFWGAQWAKDNVLSGGGAPNSFKGFADIVQPSAAGSCSGRFVTRPGNSSKPPATASGDITVLVATSVTKSGDVISGTYTDMVKVEVQSEYAPDPGHPGIGIIVPGSACTAGVGSGGGND